MNMDHWQPYLHTLLLTPSPYRTPEPFLFPSFLITSRSRFLLACLFTLFLSLLERWLTFTLEQISRKSLWWRTACFALVTAARYLLMIVVMGMDWVLLVSVVAGLTGGFAVGEWWKGRSRKDVEREEEEVVELLRCEIGGIDRQDDET